LPRRRQRRCWPAVPADIDSVTERSKRIALISTGGTIEKTYDELKGVLDNRAHVLDVVLASLQLGGVEIVRIPLMNKDSLEMTPQDHELIARTAGSMAVAHDGVVIVHGTDRLAVTGECIVELLHTPRVPIVLTGAIRPYVMRNSDAQQNLTEALLSVQILPPGVYVSMHNKVLQFPGVVKDPQRSTFVRKT
jgi:L-asparaginase